MKPSSPVSWLPSSLNSVHPSPAQPGHRHLSVPRVPFSMGWQWGDKEKAENRYSLGTRMTDAEALKYCSPCLGISSQPEEGNTRNLISEPIWAIFYTQYSYISHFSLNLWVLIQTVQPPGPLGVHLSLNIVDLQNTQILFIEQALLSRLSSDAEAFPN